MARRARAAPFALVLAASALLPVARGSAHGPVPAALSIVDEDGSGPALVRLNGGFARREAADRYRFVCPAAWGDEVVLPAARLPGGPVVVAGGRGLFVIDALGRATVHPDPNAAGSSTDFATLGDTLYVLRSKLGSTEVLEVDAAKVNVIFSEPGNWTTIAATAEAIGLQRLHDQRIEQLRIGPDGSVVERVSAPEPDDSILILARATSHELYGVLTTPGGRELGQIKEGQWLRLEGAVASIAGPIELPDGLPFVAIDTELVRLPEPRSVLEGQLPVSCLGRVGDLAYACTRDGVSALSETGLEEPIFELSSLQPPDLTRVDEGQRDPCQLQWEHFRFDLLSLGVQLTEAPLPAAGGAARPEADGGEAEPAGDAPAKREGGCTIAARRGLPPPFAWLALSGLSGLIASRARRRRLRRSKQRHRSFEQAA